MTALDWGRDGLDLPLLELAAFRYGCSGREHFADRKRFDSWHFDLMEFLTNYGAFKMVGGLNLLSKILGKPGKMNVQGHMVYDLHKAFSSPETVGLVNVECRRAGIGCIDCKNHLLRHLEPILAPLHERRIGLLQDRGRVREILAAGARRARAEARRTMETVRAAMRLDSEHGA